MTAPSGAHAGVVLPCPPFHGQTVADAVAHCLVPRIYAVLVVRRGGFLVAHCDSSGGVPRLVSHKLGRRHVQGRTAAGGWSQQRFARRREKQTDELVDAVVAKAADLLLPAISPVGHRVPDAWLVTGGDKALLREALADKRIGPLSALPVAQHLAVNDPDRDLVAKLPGLCTGAVITIRE